MFAGNRDGLTEGGYALSVTPGSQTNSLGCSAMYLRPEYSGSQVLDDETDFAPFPTLFLPGGGTVQADDSGLDASEPRSVQHTASAEGCYLLGVSSIFRFENDTPVAYTQGPYSLSVAIR